MVSASWESTLPAASFAFADSFSVIPAASKASICLRIAVRSSWGGSSCVKSPWEVAGGPQVVQDCMGSLASLGMTDLVNMLGMTELAGTLEMTDAATFFV